MREPAEKLAGSCAEAAKIGLRARESCANRLNYFRFRRCANHARDYGMLNAGTTTFFALASSVLLLNAPCLQPGALGPGGDSPG